MSIKDGGTAFPKYNAISGCDEGGMTLRDYFAAKAIRSVEARLGMFDPEIIALRCYELADAMLAEREEGDIA